MVPGQVFLPIQVQKSESEALSSWQSATPRRSLGSQNRTAPDVFRSPL